MLVEFVNMARDLQSRKGADALKLQQDILDEGGLLTPETWVSEAPVSEPQGESPPRFGFPDDYARPAPAVATESQHKGRHSGGGVVLRDTSLCQLVQLDASLVSSRREGVKGSELLLARKCPRKVHDSRKGPRTSPVRLSFDLNLYDEWLERELLGLTVCVVATSSRQGRQAEIVKASQAFLEGEIGYALDYCIMMGIWGAGYWCMNDQYSVITGEFIAWRRALEMMGPGAWNGTTRAGVWDHSLKEQFVLLSKKLETATAILDDVKRELAVPRSLHLLEVAGLAHC